MRRWILVGTVRPGCTGPPDSPNDTSPKQNPTTRPRRRENIETTPEERNRDSKFEWRKETAISRHRSCRWIPAPERHPWIEGRGSRGRLNRGIDVCNRQLTFLISQSTRRRAHVRLSDRRTVVAPSLVAAAPFLGVDDVDEGNREDDEDDRPAGVSIRDERHAQHGMSSTRCNREAHATSDERRASPQLGTKLTTASLSTEGLAGGCFDSSSPVQSRGLGVAGGALLTIHHRRLQATPRKHATPERASSATIRGEGEGGTAQRELFGSSNGTEG